MAKAEKRRGRRDLQKACDAVLAEWPRNYATDLFKRKLAEAGVKPTRRLVSKLVNGALAGQDEIELPGVEGITLEITAEDLAELGRASDAFLDELPKIVDDAGRRTAKATIKSLKQTWPERHAWEIAEHRGFQERLEVRWGEPLNLLRMELALSRELGGEVYHRNKRSKTKRNRHKRFVLSQLHVRACQVTSEVICLLENGYADGAMARWRTLYEIGVVATLISDHDDELAERYLAHEVVEARNSLKLYAQNYAELGYEPPSAAEVA